MFVPTVKKFMQSFTDFRVDPLFTPLLTISTKVRHHPIPLASHASQGLEELLVKLMRDTKATFPLTAEALALVRADVDSVCMQTAREASERGADCGARQGTHRQHI